MAQQPRPLAGEGDSLLSLAGDKLLPFFTTQEACVLRLLCREFKEAVAVFPWQDGDTVIKGSLRAWRASFPQALCANLRTAAEGQPALGLRTAPLGDEELGALAGLREVCLLGCRGFSAGALGPALAGVRKLDVSYCSSLTDAAFVHLAGVHTLRMAGCRGVSDAAFAHLRGIQVLDMSFCSQPAITDAAFAHLTGIQQLSMRDCYQATLTDAAFVHLQGIQLLNMSQCDQLTDAAFVHLRGIQVLLMCHCSQPAISDAAFAHLQGVSTLVMEGCTQSEVTGATFAHLQGIQALGMHNCRADLVAAARRLGLPVKTQASSDFGALHYTFSEVGEGEGEGEDGAQGDAEEGGCAACCNFTPPPCRSHGLD